MKQRWPRLWALDKNNRPYVVHSPRKWAEMFESGRRRVAQTVVAPGVLVSTVFLGIDHQFGKGPPLLFETMIFHNGDGRETWRYSSYDDAVIGHEMAVKKARANANVTP